MIIKILYLYLLIFAILALAMRAFNKEALLAYLLWPLAVYYYFTEQIDQESKEYWQ